MQKLQLSIPEPCHENWQEMTPTQQGRFCKACAKEVIDFSMMTDTEVLNYFAGLCDEKVWDEPYPRNSTGQSRIRKNRRSDCSGIGITS